MNSINNRENWLDIFKAIGLVTIVFCHANIKVGVFAYIFVPLFFFASGYCFKYEKAKTYLLKKIKRLYIPFFIVNIIYIFLHNIFINMECLIIHIVEK